MTRMWDYSITRRKNNALEEAEAKGLVVDSMDMRLALMARMKSGEITMVQMKKELARAKRAGKKQGLLTRSDVWRNG